MKVGRFAAAAGVVIVLVIVGSLVVSQLRSDDRKPTVASTAPLQGRATPSESPLPSRIVLPALYPLYLPFADLPAKLTIASLYGITNEGHVQTYYGAAATDGVLPELMITDTETQDDRSSPAQLGGQDVMLWRLSQRDFPQLPPDEIPDVTGVIAIVEGEPVSLIGYHLSDEQLGEVLAGLRPKQPGRGWMTGSLPAGLELIGEGDTDQGRPAQYRVEFGDSPSKSPFVSISFVRAVLEPHNACFCGPQGGTGRQVVTIDGKRGLLTALAAPNEPPSQIAIEWQYSSTTLASVVINGSSAQDALRVANGLGSPDPAVWAALDCVRFENSEIWPDPGSSYDPNFPGHPCSAPDELPLR